MKSCNVLVLLATWLIMGAYQAEAADRNATSGQGQSMFKITTGWKGSVGPVSGSVSRDGGRSMSISPNPYLGPVVSSNPKTGESSWGVGCPAGSLQLGGKGSNGKNNFIKATVGLPSRVTPQISVKIPTPSFTRAGMTTGSVKNH
jgi:hypothetical protein